MSILPRSTVSVGACESYDLDAVRQAVKAVLAPWGGLDHFVRPQMQVLLKPNLLTAARPERAVTTHPAVVQVVAELVQRAGGHVLIGDGPAGPKDGGLRTVHKSGIAALAASLGARAVSFEQVTWKHLRDRDYFLAPPVLDADLVINLPKLKTHLLTLYTGAVKNLFGVIPGTRKRDLHYRAPDVADFSIALVDVLELVQPGLTIMDGILGQEGNGPGMAGTPHLYGCLAAAVDPVAMDAVMARAMGYQSGEIIHLQQAGRRGLGIAEPEEVVLVGERQVLDFGSLDLPKPQWCFRVPAWMSAPLSRMARVRPRVLACTCTGCGRCVEVCPREAIAPGRPASIDLEACIGCLCCAEVCPSGAIEPHRNLIAKWIGTGI